MWTPLRRSMVTPSAFYSSRRDRGAGAALMPQLKVTVLAAVPTFRTTGLEAAKTGDAAHHSMRKHGDDCQAAEDAGTH